LSLPVASAMGGGFAVSLLIGELAYGQGSPDEHVTRAMLVSFVIDAAPAAVVLVGATEGIASST
jgi:hypothetical protein